MEGLGEHREFDREYLSGKLLSASKEIKSKRLLNLGGDKKKNDQTKFLANVLKLGSIYLDKREPYFDEGDTLSPKSFFKAAWRFVRKPFFNSKGEFCTSFLVETINSMLKILPTQIAGTNLSGLQQLFGVLKRCSAGVDAAVNIGKVVENKTTAQALMQTAHEFLKMGVRAYLTNIIFGNLLNTELQEFIGPIIYLLVNCLYIPWDSLTPEMDFVRDAAEEIIDNMEKK